VREALAAAGIEPRIVHLPDDVHTADKAAAALGVPLQAIVKSLVFASGERLVLALVAGTDRLDEQKLGALAGAAVSRADPRRVREETGFAIGGVAPIGHRRPLPTYCDPSLLELAEVWAGAGVPSALMALTPADLVRVSRATVAGLV
jgi:prolyl-tRNA editing enzyme YbaK/EbsC (Cys-tRNA(Pro) deacylase)